MNKINYFIIMVLLFLTSCGTNDIKNEKHSHPKHHHGGQIEVFQKIIFMVMVKHQIWELQF